MKKCYSLVSGVLNNWRTIYIARYSHARTIKCQFEKIYPDPTVSPLTCNSQRQHKRYVVEQTPPAIQPYTASISYGMPDAWSSILQEAIAGVRNMHPCPTEAHKPPSHQSPDQRRPEGGVGAADTRRPIMSGLVQVNAAWADILM